MVSVTSFVLRAGKTFRCMLIGSETWGHAKKDTTEWPLKHISSFRMELGRSLILKTQQGVGFEWPLECIGCSEWP